MYSDLCILLASPLNIYCYIALASGVSLDDLRFKSVSFEHLLLRPLVWLSISSRIRFKSVSFEHLLLPEVNATGINPDMVFQKHFL